MLIQFVVSGQPVGKARPRFVRQGRYVQAYTPDKTKMYEMQVKAAYKSIAQKHKFDPGIPISVRVRLYYRIPKSATKKRHEQMSSGEIVPMVKPDIDNVVKCICDALNGVAWNDDSQVAEVWCRKWYSDDPRAEIIISEC